MLQVNCTRWLGFAFLTVCGSIAYGQVSADSIPVAETRQLLTWLAANERRGRVNYTMEQVQVAAFIADYFRQNGLKPFSETGSMTFCGMAGGCSNGSFLPTLHFPWTRTASFKHIPSSGWIVLV